MHASKGAPGGSYPPIMKQRFVAAAKKPNTSLKALCDSYGISTSTGYRWIKESEGKK